MTDHKVDGQVSPELDVTFVQFEGSETLEGTTYTMAWVDFAEQLIAIGHQRINKKSDAPLIVPAVFAEGSTQKLKANVECVTMGALDFDNLPLAKMKKLLTLIEEGGHESILYTTWGHSEAFEEKGLYKVRLLLPFSRPVEKNEWTFFWPVFNGLFGGMGDPQCKDCSRGYFFPAVAPDTEPDQILLERFPGKALDIDHLLSSVDTLSVQELAEYADDEKPALDRDRLANFAKREKRSPIEHRSWMGSLIEKGLKGEVLAPAGSRDKTLFMLAQDLGKKFPDHSASSIAEHFRQSISQMGADGPTVQDFAAKIQRAQHSRLTEKLAKEKQEIVTSSKFRNEHRVTTFDEKCINTFCEKTGCGSNFDIFRRRLIIQYRDSYYVFKGNGYIGPRGPSEVVTTCRNIFPAAERTMGVSIYNVSDKGLETPKSLQQLMLEYGDVANEVEARAMASTAYYDENTETFVEAWHALRNIEPKHHPEVDRWIDALCSTAASAANLRLWMSAVMDLSRPLSMLCLVGATGVGKSSFATAISKLWNDKGATPMAKLFENFNDGIKKNPLMFADEKLPTDTRGRVPTDQLRSIISTDSHCINKKYQADVPFIGYLRTMAAVNSMDKIVFGKVSTPEDVEAIQKRLLIIRVRRGADKVFDFDLFVNKLAVAQHCLWLRDNTEKSKERFVTKQDDGAVGADIVLRTESVADLLAWVFWFLNTRKLEEEHDLPAFVAKGSVYLNAAGVVKYWEACHSKERIKEAEVIRALRLICKTTGGCSPRRGGRRLNYWKVSGSVLDEYAITVSDKGLTWLINQLAVYTEWEGGGLPSELVPNEQDDIYRVEALKELLGRSDVQEEDFGGPLNEEDEQEPDLSDTNLLDGVEFADDRDAREDDPDVDRFPD